MTNAERIEENNAELREAIEMAESLPDATDCVSISKTEINASGHLIITYTNGTSVDVGRVVGKDGTNATTTAVATQQANGLMSAADKKKLDNVIMVYSNGRTDIRAVASATDDFGYLYLGSMYDEVILHDWDYNEVSVGALIDAVRTICDELGITPFASNFSLRRNRSAEQTNEPNGEIAEG